MSNTLHTFTQYIIDHEDWLMERILNYALKSNYTRYTSTLREAWRLSISGLSSSLIELIKQRGIDLELGPEEDYTKDIAAQYGIKEAKLHRERGIRLDMFLGLMKYYHQSYQDMIKESPFSTSDKELFSNVINRFFDRVEIAFCTTWAAYEEDQVVVELQNRNRQMTNEKNKYLTIFESLSIPVYIVNPAGKIENMNLSASSIFNTNSVPGSKYYTESPEEIIFTDQFPWLAESYNDFLKSSKQKAISEKALDINEQYFRVSFSRSLDISGKFSGTTVIIEDITQRKKMEMELEKLATTDPLTNAKNRRSFLRLFEQELARSKRYNNRIALMLLDIDDFKHINDTYGHDIGDKVLKVLVEESHDILRGSDIFGRWGGEEFIVMLPESDTQKALMLAERLREAISQIDVLTDYGSHIKITVSIGMTIVENKDDLLDDIIKRADKALYHAKKQGRNRIIVL